MIFLMSSQIEVKMYVINSIRLFRKWQTIAFMGAIFIRSFHYDGRRMRDHIIRFRIEG